MSDPSMGSNVVNPLVFLASINLFHHNCLEILQKYKVRITTHCLTQGTYPDCTPVGLRHSVPSCCEYWWLRVPSVESLLSDVPPRGQLRVLWESPMTSWCRCKQPGSSPQLSTRLKGYPISTAPHPMNWHCMSALLHSLKVFEPAFFQFMKCISVSQRLPQ